MQDPRWEPDFGPAKFRPRWGATMVGVRKFLLAYNINLIATKEQAHRYAINSDQTSVFLPFVEHIHKFKCKFKNYYLSYKIMFHLGLGRIITNKRINKRLYYILA